MQEIEKVKLTIPFKAKNQLYRDTELFGFYKKNGEPNRNAFLNRLVHNYLDQYENDLKHYAMLIASAADKEPAGTISFKPTRESEYNVEYIQDNLLSGSTISDFYRGLFYSYLSLPQYNREQVIFRKEYETLIESVKLKQQVWFKVRSRAYTVMPYKIIHSKEELNNYLLCYNRSTNSEYPDDIMTIRLSGISGVVLLNQKSAFTDQMLERFARIEQYGPQFVSEFYDEDMIVHLSARGIRQYSRSFFQKPAYKKMAAADGRCDMYFDCSSSQLLQFFSKFGKDAVILSPASLASKQLAFYEDACSAYHAQSSKNRME